MLSSNADSNVDRTARHPSSLIKAKQEGTPHTVTVEEEKDSCNHPTFNLRDRKKIIVSKRDANFFYHGKKGEKIAEDNEDDGEDGDYKDHEDDEGPIDQEEEDL